MMIRREVGIVMMIMRKMRKMDDMMTSMIT